MDYQAHFRSAVSKVRLEGRYRVFADLEREVGSYPRARRYGADGPREVVIWCSNDYLGMGHHAAVVTVRHSAVLRARRRRRRYPQHLGHHAPSRPARARARLLHGKQAALLFTSGYVANEAAIGNDRPAAARLPDPVGCAEPRLDDRRRARLGLREADLPPQRSRSSRSAPGRAATGPRQADRVRGRLFDGRRFRPGGRDLRARAPLWGADLSRRGARGRDVRRSTAAGWPSATGRWPRST